MTVVEFITALGMTGAGQDDVLVIGGVDGDSTIESLDFEEADGHRMIVLTLGPVTWPDPDSDDYDDELDAGERMDETGGEPTPPNN